MMLGTCDSFCTVAGVSALPVRAGILYSLIMPDEFFLGGCSKAWRNDGEHIRPQFLGLPGHANRIAGTDTAGSGVNRYTAIHSINCYADDLGLLVLIEDVTLAIGAQNKNTVNSGINQPFDLINKFFTVNCSVLTHWC